MTPKELKDKLLNLISVLDDLPSNVDLLEVRVSDRNPTHVLLMSGLHDAVTALDIVTETCIDRCNNVMEIARMGGCEFVQYVNDQDQQEV